MLSYKSFGRFLLGGFVLALGGRGLPGSSAVAQTQGMAVAVPVPDPPRAVKGIHPHKKTGAGTLGYGPPGLHPGFQGFGLGYHLGYGYGGDALGVGAEGGYPHYGGPGYPHPWPVLHRFRCYITPFHYYGGAGYPTPGQPNFYGQYGPLIPDVPVVSVATEPSGMEGAGTYGSFTGGVPNAEALFAPFTARAAAGAAIMREIPVMPTLPTVPPSGTSHPEPPAP